MKDGGAIILFVIGLLTSLQFIARYFIEPILKKRNGEKPNNNWGKHPEWFYNMPFIK